MIFLSTDFIKILLKICFHQKKSLEFYQINSKYFQDNIALTAESIFTPYASARAAFLFASLRLPKLMYEFILK